MLFSYCIPVDDGAAPNPYWGVCTLAICKPKIRRAATEGDWVVGTGSRNVPGPGGKGRLDLAGKIVYAMRVSQKLKMEEYDRMTRELLPGKVPAWNNRDCRRRVGDSIYDFSTGNPPEMRAPCVHGPENMTTDLGGEYVLLSDHFYYFGDRAIELVEHLYPILKQGQGHKSWSNQPYEAGFVTWIEGLGFEPNALHGNPQIDLCDGPDAASSCAAIRRSCAEEDEILEGGDQQA